VTAVDPAPTLDDRHDAEATALEEAAVADVVGGFAGDVAAAVAAILAARAALAATAGVAEGAVLPATAAAQLAAVVVRAIGRVTPRLRVGLTRTAAAGFELGATQAGEVIAGDLAMVERPDQAQALPDRVTGPPDEPEPDVDVPDLDDAAPALPAGLDDRDLVDLIDTADARAQASLGEAAQLARTLPMDRQSDVTAVTSKATSAVNGARRDTAFVAERAVAAGIATETARAAADPDVPGEPGLLWLAERDGCLICAALSGHVVAAGDLFPDVTFGDRPLGWRVPHPPAHPHCRCRVRPYSGPPPSDDISATDPASVLAREARRSVARGWSAYDSEPARLRAADRLVRKGADLPASVVARAVSDLRAGEFSRRQQPRTRLGA
jgi:hypothetical protein